MTAHPEPLTAEVLDAGGGEIRLLVDRDTRMYPAIGSRVILATLDAAREGLDVEKERLAQALRDGDMETFTEAIREANVHHCCSACDASGHCTHGYEGYAALATPEETP